MKANADLIRQIAMQINPEAWNPANIDMIGIPELRRTSMKAATWYIQNSVVNAAFEILHFCKTEEIGGGTHLSVLGVLNQLVDKLETAFRQQGFQMKFTDDNEQKTVL